jgi:1,4-dihydroxy-2-naphthoate octaprenyltransferase
MDKAKGIHTLPVVLGERTSRAVVVGMMVLQYLFTGYVILTGFFTPMLLVVLLALPTFLRRILPLFRQPKPAEKPADFPDVWPNYFVAAAFYHNRLFGLWFLLGLIVNAALLVWVL